MTTVMWSDIRTRVKGEMERPLLKDVYCSLKASRMETDGSVMTMQSMTNLFLWDTVLLSHDVLRHSKLLSHLQRLPEEKRPQITKSSTSLSETPFASLTLRVNQPYWMLHQGNCEHFVVVDQIRCVLPRHL